MKKVTCIAAFVLIAAFGAATSAYAQLSGEQIIEKVYQNPTGEDIQGELTMTLTNKQGEQRIRNLTQ
jgi:hypothetical protein